MNQQFNGMGYGAPGFVNPAYATPNAGVTYGAVKEPAFTNPLTQEQIKKLRNNGGAFSMKVPQEDLDRAVCTHRDPATKQYTLINNADGTVTCTICGTTFNPDQGEEDIQKAVNIINNYLQTTKMMFLDIPDSTCVQYFQMIPFIQKLPQLYKISAENFNKYTGNQNQPTTQQYNAWGSVGAFFNPGQPMGGMGYQQPVANPYVGGMQPQQQQTPFMNQQSQMVGGYNAFYSTPQQQPVDMQMNQSAAPIPAPTAPVPAPEAGTAQEAQVQTTQQFKL